MSSAAHPDGQAERLHDGISGLWSRCLRLRSMGTRDTVCDMSKQTLHNAHTSGASNPDEDALFNVAESQAGYFTTAQAGRVGYSRALVSYHARTGSFSREATGVYRLVRYPASSLEDLFRVWLQLGADAVISHDSALSLYGLSDLMPGEVHATVPRNASRRRANIRLHRVPLAPSEVTRRDGLPVTTVERTIVDVATAGTSPEIVEQAVSEALARGLTDPELLIAAALGASKRVRRVVEMAVAKASG
jgi:predicted transcriptional regulator of viral defense system